jgi:hypothetical protein
MRSNNQLDGARLFDTREFRANDASTVITDLSYVAQSKKVASRTKLSGERP